MEIIRKASINDLNGINNLLYQVHDIHYKIRPDLFKHGSKKYNDDEIIKIIKDETRPIFVYVIDDKIIGYAFCIMIDNTNDPNLNDFVTLYIDDLCVDEKYRGEGIGKKLYNYVIDYAKRSGCYNVTLNVWYGNDSAMAFYESIGLNKQKIYMEKILK